MYEFLLTVHVLCAVIWVGGAVMMHIFGRLATKEGPERQLVFTGQATRLGNMLFAPLSVILLVAGVFLVDEVGYSYGDLWVTIGFLGFLTSFVLGSATTPAPAGATAKSPRATGPARRPQSRSTGARRP